MKTELTYFLPVTRANLRATMVQFADALEPTRDATEATSWSAELVTVADTGQARALVVESGILRDYGLKLTLTEDGRLAAAGVESTGQVGTVLASAFGLATSIAAAVIFRLPVPLPTVPPVVTKSGNADTMGTPRMASPAEERYLKECPGEAQHLTALQDQLATSQEELAEARRSYLAIDLAGRAAAWSHYRRVVRLVADVSDELTRAKALFDAWRHSHQKTTQYVEAVSVELTSLPLVSSAADGRLVLAWSSGDDAATVCRFFEHTNYVLARSRSEEWPSAPATPAKEVESASLRVRRPRSVGLVCVHRDGDGVLWQVDDRRELIMDAFGTEVHLPLRKSWLARRKTAVELSSLGALTSIELGGDASGAAAAAGLAGVGASATAALESAQTTRTTLAALSAVGAEDELARLKRQTAITEQRLLAAGQAATAADFARLEWLKQQVAIAEAQTKLRGPGD